MEAPKIDAPAYRTLIRDIFLLPDLPGRNNDGPFLNDLPKLLIYALEKYKDLSPPKSAMKLRQCCRSIGNFQEARAKTDQINEQSVQRMLKSGGAAAIPLYLRYHNTGVIIRWSQSSQHRIEFFQLSPRVGAVTLTVGRLRRQFPEISVSIKENVAADERFTKVVAETLAEMDKAEVPGLKPVRKTGRGKQSEDKCDATLSDHIFDILVPFLLTEQSEGPKPRSQSIVKHTRDYVLFVDEKKAVVRRSPIWLLLKVVLQQELRSHDDDTTYKQFMLVFLAMLLDGACACNLDSPTIHCMARKIGYRTWKLQSKAMGPWMEVVDIAVKRASDLLNRCWKKIVQADQDQRAIKLPLFISDATDCHVKLSELDKFLARVRECPPEINAPVLDPKSDITTWAEGKLPNMNDVGKESSNGDVFNLIKVEQWVEDYLPSFVQAQGNDVSTCSDIKKFATAYFKRASAIYKDSPDHMSVMYLTMLELWIACDRCVVARNTLLQDYTPLGVEKVDWQSLMLRTKRDMLRLSMAEDYLESRSSDKLNMVGKSECFASRFAQASKPHLTLMATIESDMAKLEQEKSDELNQLKEKQKFLLDAHKNGTCDPSKCRVGTSNLLCQRCNQLAVACSLTIAPLQKILPDDPEIAYNLIFELQVPPDISAWRDFCYVLQLDVAGHMNRGPKPGLFSYMRNYTQFERYFRANGIESKSRITLASAHPEEENPPVTVRQDLKLADLCVPHSMRWKLFDSSQGAYIEDIRQGDLMDKTCSMGIGDENKLLQQVLADPSMTQNELISRRLEAETTIMAKHNEELGSLYIGDNITWPKILRDLRGTSIDWTAPETFLIITAVAMTVGPKRKGSGSRLRHYQLGNAAFSTKVLDEVMRLLTIYTASFSGRRALAVFCSIALRILTEAPDSCHESAFGILRKVRKVCFCWLRDVRFSGIEMTTDMLETRLDIALICSYAFNVDYALLKHVLWENKAVGMEQYVFAMTIIHEGNATSPFQKALFSAWQRLSVTASGILAEVVRHGQPSRVRSGLIFSLGESTSLTPDEDRFEHVSGPWVKTYTQSSVQSVSKIIHLNLMTGEILIDGKSPRHLSSEYRAHQDFHALFGDMNPAVTPLHHSVYQYRFRHPFKGFIIEVGMEKMKMNSENAVVRQDLHVRAGKGSTSFVLTPRHMLTTGEFPFPSEYLDNYIYWHEITDGGYKVDLYPRQSPWDKGAIAWSLESQQDDWLLKEHEGGRIVMPASCHHFVKLSKIFEHFTAEDDLTVTVHNEKKILDVRLGTLGLNFYVNNGSTVIRSVEFEDMCIDHDFLLQTLIGLRQKLILRHSSDQSNRILLVADGEDKCLWTRRNHTQVSIDITKETTYQAYSIDMNLKQLRGNQTWRSKAYLAYLSALTSHCLPDPFTCHTGQETALNILTSGAMVSFDSLSDKDRELLEKIRDLAPERQLRKRPGTSLPTVKWSQKLNPVAQHEGYCFAVEKIFSHAEILASLSTGFEFARKSCSEAELRLREADAVRFACFRATGYSNHDGARDADYYFRIPEKKQKATSKRPDPIDYGSSDAFRRGYMAALGAKLCQRFTEKAPAPGNLLIHMTKCGTLKTATDHYDVENLRYTSKWLDPEESTLVQDLSSIHKALVCPMAERNPYRLRLWLSTVACGMESGVAGDVIPVLVALVGKKLAYVALPTKTNPDISLGCEYSADRIAATLNVAKRQWAPEADVFLEETDDHNATAKEFCHKQDKEISLLAGKMAGQGFFSLGNHSKYFDVEQAEASVKRLFRTWDLNKKWTRYCEDLSRVVSGLPVSDAKPPSIMHALPDGAAKHLSGHVTIEAMMAKAPASFDKSNTWRTRFKDEIRSHMQWGKHEVRAALIDLPWVLGRTASKQHEKDYIAGLETSIKALENHRSVKKVVESSAELDTATRAYKAEIEERLKACAVEADKAIRQVTTEINPTFASVIRHSDVFPNISLCWFLSQLSFSKQAALTEPWRNLIQQMAALCRDRQHMKRITQAGKNGAQLLHELQTLDRPLPARQSAGDGSPDENPPKEDNSVMQLNMGEGKSSVIIPILSASLAQGKTLVRVFVGRHQSAQMRDTMTAAMGGLMNRSVLCMPYNRDSKLRKKDIEKLKGMAVRCVKSGGVLLLQPENHLSLLLSTCLNEDTTLTRCYVSLVKYLRETCRDIIDECDELLSPSYELLYTLGTPEPVDFAPDRWVFIQNLLGLLARYANPKALVVTEDEVLYKGKMGQSDAYPAFTFLSPASLCKVLTEVGREFIIRGITGFSVKQYSPSMKRAIKEFVIKANPTSKTVRSIEQLGGASKSGLALVRGCIAGDIFRVALLQKRWRVDYGCDFERVPNTRLAVPFSAKDVPKPRAEFSNTDIVIIFTQLSYYQSGLREQDVRDLVEQMRVADDGHDLYRRWFSNEKMPWELRELKAVNLQDERQFRKLFFHIQYSVEAINYFLGRLVFPTELGAFSRHMAASGWDLAEKTTHPTTGFSGTTDLCAVLPLGMNRHDLPSQEHTNALVLNNILHSDNTVFSMHQELEKRLSDGSDFIEHVIMDGRIRVLLDVGAQVIKFSNKQVAETWLQLTKNQDIKAVVFFSDSEVLSVMDHSLVVMPLKESVYAKKLDACAVFLDEAHTRGTDLRLPLNYKAAVTLGPGLTKDRLAQACMRMRNLGKGQTLVFYVSFEVENDIRKLLQLPHDQPLTIDRIIQWSISQTQASITRQMPHWAKQGRRHKLQSEAWEEVLKIKPTSEEYEGIEEQFKAGAASAETDDEADSDFDHRHSQFIDRCREYGYWGTTSLAGNVDETCEREVAPEVEDEKEVLKPPKPDAKDFFSNIALEKFISHGKIDQASAMLEWAFESLHRTTLATMVKKLQFPGNLRVTNPFATAVLTENPTDNYQQHVAYVLHTKPSLVRHPRQQAEVVIISQVELENYWDKISQSKFVSLHCYNAKVTPDAAALRAEPIYPLDGDLVYAHPVHTRIALDLFAGQLYFSTYDEYVQVSSFLGLVYFEETGDMAVDPDGFVPPPERHKIPPWHRRADQYWDTFSTSPVSFFKQFLSVVRGHGAGIEHTHMGRILDGGHLGKYEFPDTFRLRGPDDAEAAVVEVKEKSSVLDIGPPEGHRKRERLDKNTDAAAAEEPASKRQRNGATAGSSLSPQCQNVDTCCPLVKRSMKEKNGGGDGCVIQKTRNVWENARKRKRGEDGEDGE
ncbi:very large low complexity [Cordyceps militaris]|uniref:ubiquitinyl hydrolase 1 n=1 Tax=Cordyceps militaris TaxID=73501 RepID=A0A2H4SPE3_CORMI|nr:very large low complexity [Cordyceps militaris]